MASSGLVCTVARMLLYSCSIMARTCSTRLIAGNSAALGGGAHVNVVRLLLDRGAPLEELNIWGGTVLEHAGWGFEHNVAGSDFAPVFEALLASGAKIRGRWLAWLGTVKTRSAEERSRVGEIFRHYGATV